MKTVESVIRDLRAAATPGKSDVLVRFFKTGPGEYGEGDRFLGVMVPQIRQTARSHRQSADIPAARALLDSPWHEVRECGLFILVDRFKSSREERAACHDAYMDALGMGRVNNWDLIDCSAPTLIGSYLLDAPHGTTGGGSSMLDALAVSGSLWENRAAVVSTLAFIRGGRLDVAFRQCEAALGHAHDLMHKAVGWMLRECGKRDPDALRAFLAAHLREMPRTSLRYAIERFSREERSQWLNR